MPMGYQAITRSRTCSISTGAVGAAAFESEEEPFPLLQPTLVHAVPAKAIAQTQPRRIDPHFSGHNRSAMMELLIAFVGAGYIPW